jgi:methylated-DNA-[protein]-cysteine S-methyltransferase
MIYTHIDTPLGTMIAAAKDGRLAILSFLGQKHFPADAKDWLRQPADPLLVALRSWLKGYFSGMNSELDLPLAPRGTPFQQAVWKILLRIPRGATITYGEIARKVAEEMGRPHMSAQAVGGAVGRNPIAILIPCHRVVGADGSLTGYAGGLEKKRALLRLEGIPMTGP